MRTGKLFWLYATGNATTGDTLIGLVGDDDEEGYKISTIECQPNNGKRASAKETRIILSGRNGEDE